MEVQTLTNESTLIARKSFEAHVESVLSGGLNLKTAEGDVVRISVGSQESFSTSGGSTQTAGGEVNQEFSIASLSASRFALSVEGDLNEEELNAIRLLVDQVDPIATQFFSGQEFDLGEAAFSLGQNLGVIQELELSLEKSVTAVFASETFTQIPVPQAPADPSVKPLPLAALTGIRDLPGLVSTTVETAFTVRATQILKDQEILRSLQDLIDFLKNRLEKFVLTGENQFRAAAPEAPQDALTSAQTGQTHSTEVFA